MRFYKPLCTVIVALIVTINPAQAKPQYTESPPLDRSIKTPVGEVAGGTVQLPVITWGADIRTIYANGNEVETEDHSIFDKLGLKFKLVREDVFSNQVENYISGKTPYLRGTLGMINMAVDVLSKDPRTVPVVVYQLSESAGGDALVVKEGIKAAKDLKGKTIALQAYGPHVDYLAKVLTDAGLSFADVQLRWLADLTGTDNAPPAAFHESDIDAAMMIIPDALALTSDGTVGTGSGDSVRGATIMLSTKTANRVIADVYAVRSDYLQKNRAKVQAFVHGLMQAQEEVAKLVQAKTAKYDMLMRMSATVLLDNVEAAADAEALYADAEHVGYAGNVKFFTDPHYPRNMAQRTREIQQAFSVIDLVGGTASLSGADWDYTGLQAGLSKIAQVEAPKFDERKVAEVITKKQQQGKLDEGELFSFEVLFKPNQNTFPADAYQDAFNKVIDLASTYGGAVITVEGHSDPLGYLRKKKDGAAQVDLTRIRQAAKNLSLTRGNAVRDSVVSFAKGKHINMDPSQFAVIGHGIDMPKSGICGADPCAPKTEQDWKNNMRVVFRLIQVEAEAEVFSPL